MREGEKEGGRKEEEVRWLYIYIGVNKLVN